MKKLTCIIAILIYPFVMSAQYQKPEAFSILLHTGSIPESTKVYLLYQTNGKKIFDSTVVKNNRIEFTGSIESMLPATIVLDDQAIGLQSLMKKRTGIDYLKIYLFPGSSEAVATNGLASAVFKGPGVNHDFGLLQRTLKSVDDEWARVSRELVLASDPDSIKILRYQYDSLNNERVPLLEQFVLQHPKSFISLVAWENWKGLRLRRDESAIGEVRALFETLAPEIRNAAEASQARIFFANQAALKPGQQAPEFVQPDSNGKPVKLSDFRGKYLLLDFWASWCGPCRVSSPELVKLYEEFRRKNFIILGISLDDKQGKKDWLKAIKTDGLKWPQVSDLRHWDNAVVKRYSVAAVPFNVLIDPEGKIIQLGGSVDEVRRILLNLNLK
jgi:peroxiredoxin